MTQIAPARFDDIAAIVGLMQRAYRGEESKKGWTSEADLIDGDRTTPEDIGKVLANPNHHFLVARDAAGQIIGCADIEWLDDPARSCSFGKFAVEPSLQGSGLGKQLMQAAEAAAVAVFGAHRMTMTVIEGRAELVAFYQRRGYRATGSAVSMADIHHDPSMTRGHNLILLEYDKSLQTKWA
ncbi:tRNA(Met) cytidine acetyltransferase TmcA [Candidatus Phycosocius bacilliformis]|uniref:tRNA(Met) cytidine acetyltransferase TmcA n=1 Tax=Candidatus Phycosocius bacilliformis TaxID=1445552 RepID=A0A2P2E8G3_9PROT|nr:GNAT family N-acetyltransferase [Candidatus Phycosocius bacilliformis]GBF57352.1 tRNA(Met) cytidine acetyltransferase TmcA [Candidatus Phycosocius bacilliformis]